MTLAAPGEAEGPGSAGEALAWARRRLGRAGVETPRLDARVLLAAALGVDAGPLVAARRPLSPGEARAYRALIERRAGGRPVSRLLGRRGFWDLELELDDAVLDPRPESECLVEAVLARLAPGAGPLRLLDLGTGSGCLLLALLGALAQAWGVGLDRSAAAIATARRNARRLGLDGRAAFLVSDWAAALAGRFDVVVANPPYVARDELDGLAPEVRAHDPRLALDGGTDGLDGHRALAGQLGRLLAPGGFAAIECGAGQAAAAGAIFRRAELRLVDCRPDLGGRPRCLIVAAAD